MKRWMAWLLIFVLLFCGCSANTPAEMSGETEEPLADIEARLKAFYPEATPKKINDGEHVFWEVTCETDMENYDEIQYSGTLEGYKYISSLEALRKIDSRHYCIVRGYRVGSPRQRVRFLESGSLNLRESSFTVRVTGICHKTDEEIEEEITVIGSGYLLLPHGEKRVLHKGQLELPEENVEYFFVLNKTHNGVQEVYHYYNPLVSDLRIDQGLKNAKKLTEAQMLTREMMEEYL